MFVPQRDRHQVHPDDEARQHLQQHLRVHLHNPTKPRNSRRHPKRRHQRNRGARPLSSRPAQRGPQSQLLPQVRANTSTSRDVLSGFPFITVTLTYINSRQQHGTRRSGSDRRRRRAGSHCTSTRLPLRACFTKKCNLVNFAVGNLQEYIRVYSDKEEVWSMDELKERLRVNAVVW